MMEREKTLFKKYHHLVLYGIIGSFSALFDFCVYILLVRILNLPYLMANCCSVFAGITCSFCLNRSYNFRVKDHVKRRFATFLTVGLSGLVLSNFILYLLIDLLMTNMYISKALSILFVAFAQFLINKHYTFESDSKGEF